MNSALPKKIGIILLALGLLLVLVFFTYFFFHTRSDKYENAKPQNSSIPKFTTVPLDFIHHYADDISLPLAPSALIDIDNDAVDEVFFGGGLDQNDAMLAYRDGKFVDIIGTTGIPKKAGFTTLGIGSADFDNNGFSDLIVSREDGLTIYYNQNGKFTAIQVGTPISDKLIPTGITVGDINKDGHVDIFLTSCYKKQTMESTMISGTDHHESTSALLINKGNNTFVNSTQKAGLTTTKNAYSGMIIDIDNDSWLDLIVAYERGEVRIYENNEGLRFVPKENPLTHKIASLSGIASGDYNNDGYVDFFFPNRGDSFFDFRAMNPYKDSTKIHEKWSLFKNNGDFTFTDVAEETQLADYEWAKGAVMADMNNDGLQDLIVAQNDVDFFPNKLFKFPGRFLMQKEDHTFAPVEALAGVESRQYNISPLISDFNLDGYLDLIWTNINAPSFAYISNGGTNNFVQVKISSDAVSLGAKINVLTPTKNLLEHFVVGEGLCGDQTSLVHFGLGDDTKIHKIFIYYTDSRKDIVKSPKVNSIVEVKQRHLIR